MLSNDTKSVALCVRRLSSRLLASNDALSPSELDLVAGSLSRGGTTIAAPPPSGGGGEEEGGGVPLADAAAATAESLLRLLADDTGAPEDVPFALLLLRLVVLEHPDGAAGCAGWLFGAMAPPPGDDGDGTAWWKAPVSRSLAWCAASNCLAASVVPIGDATALVDAATGDWRHGSVQVRQAASAFLYNYALLVTNDEKKNNTTVVNDDDGGAADDAVVSVLCSAMENLTGEKDPTTRLRQLVVCGRLVFPDRTSVNEVARELMQDLGFVGILRELTAARKNDDDDDDGSSSSSSQHADAERCHLLSLELIDKFRD